MEKLYDDSIYMIRRSAINSLANKTQIPMPLHVSTLFPLRCRLFLCLIMTMSSWDAASETSKVRDPENSNAPSLEVSTNKGPVKHRKYLFDRNFFSIYFGGGFNLPLGDYQDVYRNLGKIDGYAEVDILYTFNLKAGTLGIGLNTEFVIHHVLLSLVPRGFVPYVLRTFLFGFGGRFTTKFMLPATLFIAGGAGPTLDIVRFEGEVRHPDYTDSVFSKAFVFGAYGLGWKFTRYIGVTIYNVWNYIFYDDHPMLLFTAGTDMEVSF